MNSINLVGNISSDIDIRALNDGKFVAKFDIAVTNPYKHEKTSFLPVECWGRVAENTSNFCKKGSKVSVSGYVEVDQWQNDQGQNRYKTKIVADKIGFLTPKSSGGQQQQQQNNQNQHDPFANNGQPVNISDQDLPF
ncbi:single-stranded DNA-binding protein [Rossellomorea marisflavi]|uniref:single-stranded DNA-binding protein n=1 Tax=Rossellomorea marisflavi TaxID=189381 RepID=UPI00345DD8B3